METLLTALPFLGLNLLGLALLHLQVIIGKSRATGAPANFSAIGEYVKAKGQLTLLASVFISVVVFYFVWDGMFAMMGFAGGAAVKGGYLFSGYFSELLWDEAQDIFKSKLPKGGGNGKDPLSGNAG